MRLCWDNRRAPNKEANLLNFYTTTVRSKNIISGYSRGNPEGRGEVRRILLLSTRVNASALDLQVSVLYPSFVALERFLSRTPQECPVAHVELRTVAAAGQDGFFQLSLG
jgi:hypothetical protein